MLTLIADLGDLLRLHAAYNAATVVELARAAGGPVHLASPPDPESPVRAALEVSGLELREVAPDWAWAEGEAEQMREFLQAYPQGQERLRAAGQAQRALAEALAGTLTAARVHGPELLGAADAYHRLVREQLGEGPGNAHRKRRLEALRSRLEGASGVLVAPLDDLPELLRVLPDARLPALGDFRPGESSRLRALADRALRLEEGDDLEALVRNLLEAEGDALTPGAELRYAAANVYLAVGDLPSARSLLEEAGHAQLERPPRYLFGLVYARLGQVRDALGDRENALRAYRAVLALPWAPQAALEAARAGLELPFTLEVEER
ncbi:tetratricopeptide (TPR) repeat protein [Deinobacterium chartae]|uniref:Tetratricopeptide (TPR) repeat protein n=1 Tax=Deinobacterium chartae TaxID=521158 RepID=A0A841HXS8_9DEIO|nr:hypothetical protein [Deinobacterium chartae]MBB6097696.1 tetratricopeptide (TPR) repeat protein [Deinobacterium chartae]